MKKKLVFILVPWSLIRNKFFSALVGFLIFILIAGGALAGAGALNRTGLDMDLFKKYFVDGFRFFEQKVQISSPAKLSGGEILEVLNNKIMAEQGEGRSWTFDQAAVDYNPRQAYRNDVQSGELYKNLFKQGSPQGNNLGLDTLALLSQSTSFNNLIQGIRTRADARLSGNPETATTMSAQGSSGNVDDGGKDSPSAVPVPSSFALAFLGLCGFFSWSCYQKFGGTSGKPLNLNTTAIF